MIADSQITFIYTKDLDTSARFYQEILGFQEVLDQGKCRVYRVSADGYLGICQTEKDPDPGDTLFTVVTSRVDEIHAVLVENDIVCEHAPRQNDEYMIYHFFVRDPDGYLLEIQEFNDPDWNVAGR